MSLPFYGMRVVLSGGFASVERKDSLTLLLKKLGAEVDPVQTGQTTLIVNGNRSQQLRSLWGTGHGNSTKFHTKQPTIWTEDQLATRVAEVTGIASLRDAVAAALQGTLTVDIGDDQQAFTRSNAGISELVDRTTDATHAELVELTKRIIEHGGSEALVYLRRALVDSRLIDAEIRERIVRALESYQNADALVAIYEALCVHQGVFGSSEALAFGRLCAKGITRWNAVRPPYAIEFDEDYHQQVPHEILALASRAGKTEVLYNPEGCTVWRVRIYQWPGFSEGTTVPAHPVYQLLTQLSHRRAARVWIAGCCLPTSLPWEQWSALLQPLVT